MMFYQRLTFVYFTVKGEVHEPLVAIVIMSARSTPDIAALTRPIELGTPTIVQVRLSYQSIHYNDDRYACTLQCTSLDDDT